MRNRDNSALTTSLGCILAWSVFSSVAHADMSAYRTGVKNTPGIVDHFDFEGNYHDSVDGGNGLNNGVASGAQEPTYTGGVSNQGQAAEFDGIGNVVTVVRSIEADYTIMGWILAPEVQAGVGGTQYWQGAGLVYADIPGGADDFGVGVNGSKLAHGIGNPDTTVLSTSEVAGPTACGWSHFAAVRRVVGAVTELELYVNGSLQASGVVANPRPLTATGSISIAANAVDNRFFKGIVDEVSLFTVALTDEDITALFTASGYSQDVSECPAPDARCDDLLVEGPPGDRIGVYNLTATGSDPIDPLTYTFKAAHPGGTTLVVGPQDVNVASFIIDQPGKWTFSVFVDDLPCCPDGASATCTQMRDILGYGFTDAIGRITGDAFLALGPFTQIYGCNPAANINRNFIAPDRINCVYPRAGDTAIYDPTLAASDAYVGPTGPGGEPLWRVFDDGTSYDGDQALEADSGATVLGNVVTWLVTYVEYRGANPVVANVCLGSDDSGVLYINRDRVISSAACRGRGDCDGSAAYTFAPGVHRIAAAAFQGGGGWGLRVKLDVGGVPVLGDSPDWVFHGRTRPAGFVPPECSSCLAEPVTDLTCTFGRVGLGTGLVMSWTNPAITDVSSPTIIKINGVEITAVASTATSAQILGTLLPPGGAFFVAEVVHCGGVPASCSPFGTNASGQILGSKLMVLGPFSHTHGCGGDVSALEGNHLAPSHIACQFPAVGDEVEYDANEPGNASTAYLGPLSPNSKPLWRRFDDGTPADGDQDLSADQGPTDNAMSWMATYIEYKGPGSKTITICLGSDDGGQLWFNDQLLLTRNVCSGRAECQSSATITIEPGAFRLAVGGWNAFGGWGLILSLTDADTLLPIVDDGKNTVWVFHGTRKPALNFSCTLVEPVVLDSCQRNGAGDLDLSWTHQQPVETLRILANGVMLREVPGSTTSLLIPAGELPNDDPLRVCIENGSQPAACCFVKPVPECLHHYTLDGHVEDEVGDNHGVFAGGVELDPVFVDGQNGSPEGAILFDGIDDNVQIGRTVASEFTIAFWVLSELSQAGVAGEQYWQGTGLVYADVPGGANDFGTAITGDVFAFGIGNPDQTVHSTTPVVGPGVGWKHVAATRGIDLAMGASILNLYVDGVLENTLMHPNLSPLDAPANITIGGNAVDGRYFSGAIDDVHICNYPLDANEILDLMIGGPRTGAFHRGDADNNGKLELTDAIRILGFLFLGGAAPTCLDAADADDNGLLQLTDAIRILGYLFLGQAPPATPGPPDQPCGIDATPDAGGVDQGCLEYTNC